MIELFERLKDLGERLQESHNNNVDASKFNDPVATKTDWKPINKGPSSNFDMCRLAKAGSYRLVYTTTLGLKIFCALFVAGGLGFYAVCVSNNGFIPEPLGEGVMAQFASLLFVAIGAGIYIYSSHPAFFDRRKNVFISGRGDKRISVPFSRVHALQLISKYVSDSDGSYYNYQLNLVLDDAKREYVINYYSLKNARSDARTLSRFTGKKLWDATHK